MKTKIVTVYCKKNGDRNRIYGFSFSPDEFQIFSVLTGAFFVSALVGIFIGQQLC